MTPWHADQFYWPLDGDRTVTAWVPLQAVPVDMGPLAFAPGSQHLASGRDLPIGDGSEAALAGLVADVAPYALGDVSFHGGRTFHRAGPNTTGVPRRVMTVIYMDADIGITEPVNDFQRSDRDRWLGGAGPGPVPDGGGNPVLFAS